jgi:S1-C subfamily serine protease
MSATFRVLSGGRTGVSYAPAGDEFVAGRQPDAELRFDPELDRSVSGRHARFVRRDGAWAVQDLDSTNGTFVNGRPVRGVVQLRNRDRVTFGTGGPEVEFLADSATMPGFATMRVRAAVSQERKRGRVVAAALLALVLLLGTTLALMMNNRARNTWIRERAELEQRVDSLLAERLRTEASLQVEVTGLSVALQESEQRLQRLRSELATPSGSGADDTEELRRDLVATSSALRRQQLAASLDFAAIQRRARGAVAMVWVEYTDGERTTGTAFAVRPDGTLLTNRHLLRGAEDNLQPGRIAVRFSDSDQAFPARVLAVSRDWDLAAIRVENVLGEVPVVPGFSTRAESVAPGAPVALIGYPLGGEPERGPDAAPRVARPVVSAGLVLRSSERSVEIQGLGAAGASGSPILDGTGEVIAVLFGGRHERGVQVLLGVPAAAAAAFVRTLR